MKPFFKSFEKAQIFESFKVKNFDRTGPLWWVFLFALAFLIIGLAVEVLKILAWIGGLIIIIYVAVWIGFIKNKF